jgi:pimeloyl-ACP methyl ester carboxylesterase
LNPLATRSGPRCSLERACAATALLALVAQGCTRNASAPATGSLSPVPCAQIRTLRELGRSLAYATNPRTGDTIEYVVIGDGAVSSELLVMFPGTGQILPDWPMQLLTNRKYSPKIASTFGYQSGEDGPVSLCHDYRMVVFDYPGVGRSPLKGNVTSDRIAGDVDAMLQDAGTKFGVSTDVVDPVGWSLGTTEALKYAFLSAVARPRRTIRNLVLIATSPGGNTEGQVGSNSAACQVSLFTASLHAGSALLGLKIKGALSKLIFPYVGQGPHDNGTKSGCTASIRGKNIDLSVQLNCSIRNNCAPWLVNDVASLLTYPWSATRGINQKLFAQQRQLAHDWSVAYCASAGPSFTSTSCSAYGKVQQSVRDGGVCQTDTANPDLPLARACVPLKISGRIAVVNGYEDLFIQWTYSKALVSGYNAAMGSGRATLATYPGPAGHGVLIQHPKWTQMQIEAALRAT